MQGLARGEAGQYFSSGTAVVLPTDQRVQLLNAVSSAALMQKVCLLDNVFQNLSVMQMRVLLWQCMTDISILSKRNEWDQWKKKIKFNYNRVFFPPLWIFFKLFFPSAKVLLFNYKVEIPIVQKPKGASTPEQIPVSETSSYDHCCHISLGDGYSGCNTSSKTYSPF